MKSQSANIVYLNDDVDYQAVCGSTAVASTLVRSSVPGLRWVVRGGHDLQRSVWSIIWLFLILLSVVLCIVFSVLQSEEEHILKLQ